MSYLNPVSAVKPCISAMVSAVTSAPAALTQKVASAASAVISAIGTVANRIASAFSPLKGAAQACAALCGRFPVSTAVVGAATVTAVAYVAAQHFGYIKPATVAEAVVADVTPAAEAVVDAPAAADTAVVVATEVATPAATPAA